MKTNKEFGLLSVEEQAAYLSELTESEVEELTKDQGIAYQAWLNKGGNDIAIEETDDVAKVAAYMEANPEYPFDEIILTSDGLFFPGSLKGENSASNHCGTTRTYAIYKTK